MRRIARHEAKETEEIGGRVSEVFINLEVWHVYPEDSGKPYGF